ncbi:MAG: ABC transporter substrate-binding protein [Gammaproteobacteria bacterium]|nr:ABC transporter substrate-binding protein [Gammaproteobacteria bacterium]
MKIRCLIILLVSSLLAAPAFARQYTVGIIPYIPAGEFVVADYKGFYQAEGLDVKSIYYTSTGDWVRALANNKLDFSGLWNATQVDMYYRGSSAKRLALMSYDSDDYKMVIPKDMTPKKLKGKNVAVFADYFGTHWFIQNYMSQGGLTMRDVNIVEMNNLEGSKNFDINRVSGMIFNGKYMNQSLKSGKGKLAPIDRELYIAATTGGPSYFESEEKIPRDILKKFLKAWVKSMIWIEDDKNAPEYKEILHQAFKDSLDLAGIESDADYLALNPRSMLIPTKDLYRVNSDTPKTFKTLNKIRREIGYKNDRHYKPEDMYDTSIIIEVLNELGLTQK